MVNLMAKLKSILRIDIKQSYFWIDSTIVLSWLNSEPARWSTFVANRVSIVQSSSSVQNWYHVPSKLNPADLVSRGAFPQQLENDSLWWDDLNFIKCNKEFWPSYHTANPVEDTDLQTTAQFSDIEFWNSHFLRFSTLTRLQRSLVAYS